ncbi:hypothetical protein A3G53_03645 [Candidatus Nomurabacteria bacterium RIFCSPLOWO2_12_FULL_44_11]|uniref:Four helix bundle protein n=1 Tax=Candidatus Nomurabacteria bacterium RIFCSPLOWO2_12_FULL_44_11 TaxID=1801796 RepID=A0A1F6Y4G2_9BACT|nr:MAG: hypothetical protein A3G53_03645 [Candidatus Nomurabacteria bacterium RIFCSPLOWO2_12_FULL_44_11]
MKIISAYVYWNNIIRHIPKIRRYSLGVKIDCLFSDIIEFVSMAQFSAGEQRGEILTQAIAKNDCLKSMLYVLFELKGIEEKYFVELAQKVEEIGKILYGWKNQPVKTKNASTKVVA